MHLYGRFLFIIAETILWSHIFRIYEHTKRHILFQKSQCNAIKFDDVAHRKLLSVCPDLCHQNWYIYIYVCVFFRVCVFGLVLVQQFSIFPCIKQWNGLCVFFLFSRVALYVWIAFRGACNTQFQNIALQSRKSHGNVLTFLAVNGCWSSVVSSFHTHIRAHAFFVANMLAASSRRRLFNLIEIYSVCVHVGLSFVSSRIAFALYIFTSNNLSSSLVCHSFIWTDFGWSDDGLQKNLCARISFDWTTPFNTRAPTQTHAQRHSNLWTMCTL